MTSNPFCISRFVEIETEMTERVKIHDLGPGFESKRLRCKSQERPCHAHSLVFGPRSVGRFQ